MLSPLTFQADPKWLVPDKDACFALWDKYNMLQNIREHSIMVAKTALHLASLLKEKGYDYNRKEILASGLLHDIAKTYTIYHGGDHAQLGAAIVRLETNNPHLAQSILYHVHWPWDDNIDQISLCLPLVMSYADKRVLHHEITTLEVRFQDLMSHYGTNESSRYFIQKNHDQSKAFEKRLQDMGIIVDFNHLDITSLTL